MSTFEEIVAKARRDLIKANGAMTPEDREQDRRDTLVEEMDQYMWSRFRSALLYRLKGKVVWQSEGPILACQIEDSSFRMRYTAEKPKLPSDSLLFNGPERNAVVIHVLDNEEKILLEIDGNDPQFANRALIAMADAAAAHSLLEKRDS